MLAACATGHNPFAVLALSRQGLEQLRLGDEVAPLKSATGGYILQRKTKDSPEVVLIASGSEVGLAAEARTRLEAMGKPCRVVSVPCLELLLEQPQAEIDRLLPEQAKWIVIEAGIEMGWHQLTRGKGQFIGMNSFGASAPIDALYTHFGITADAVIEAATA